MRPFHDHPSTERDDYLGEEECADALAHPPDRFFPVLSCLGVGCHPDQGLRIQTPASTAGRSARWRAHAGQSSRSRSPAM